MRCLRPQWRHGDPRAQVEPCGTGEERSDRWRAQFTPRWSRPSDTPGALTREIDCDYEAHRPVVPGTFQAPHSRASGLSGQLQGVHFLSRSQVRERIGGDCVRLTGVLQQKVAGLHPASTTMGWPSGPRGRCAVRDRAAARSPCTSLGGWWTFTRWERKGPVR